MKHTEVIDWRVWKGAVITKDGPPIVPGGQPVKAGDHLYVVTDLKGSKLGNIHFPTPSPVALALNAAIKAAKRAVELRTGLHTQPGNSGTFSKAVLPALYQFFEECMVAATFSFQALESFANQLIAENLKGTFAVVRREGTDDWDPPTIERRCSTGEKLGTVLPAILSVPTPKGQKLWENFVHLKEIRDSTIHLKSENQYVRGRPDEQTLYFQLINCDPLSFPKSSLGLMKHFQGSSGAGWIQGAESQF